ncbi:hypothetical protein [Mangrovivirga cuniculi]|uniref:Uncharacterized protein n=1 Tax=Mangrovivirga cuniculi TaxID=2715131 RepID=A0A4D7JM59_9BACT|nr:hypothetical protein [Mangrovivirga cuniculi]QCK14570.1 hypothetical protein DCC35_07350 [Mangrovivirga cuniculi]
MNQREKYIDDLKDIREMMNRSSRFISLSGMSGVCAGIFALIGSYLTYDLIYTDVEQLGSYRLSLTSDQSTKLMVIGAVVFFAAIFSAIFFTVRKARKNNQRIWDYQTRRLLENFFIPLTGGGIVCVILLFKGYYDIIAGLTLMVYGLSLINASSVTYKEVKSLGIAELILGILAVILTGYGLLFWAVGFGVLHIVYGVLMQIRHK